MIGALALTMLGFAVHLARAFTGPPFRWRADTSDAQKVHVVLLLTFGYPIAGALAQWAIVGAGEELARLVLAVAPVIGGPR